MITPCIFIVGGVALVLILLEIEERIRLIASNLTP